jgi:hypothetical protein
MGQGGCRPQLDAPDTTDAAHFLAPQEKTTCLAAAGTGRCRMSTPRKRLSIPVLGGLGGRGLLRSGRRVAAGTGRACCQPGSPRLVGGACQRRDAIESRLLLCARLRVAAVIARGEVRGREGPSELGDTGGHRVADRGAGVAAAAGGEGEGCNQSSGQDQGSICHGAPLVRQK